MGLLGFLHSQQVLPTSEPGLRDLEVWLGFQGAWRAQAPAFRRAN